MEPTGSSRSLQEKAILLHLNHLYHSLLVLRAVKSGPSVVLYVIPSKVIFPWMQVLVPSPRVF